MSVSVMLDPSLADHQIQEEDTRAEAALVGTAVEATPVVEATRAVEATRVADTRVEATLPVAEAVDTDLAKVRRLPVTRADIYLRTDTRSILIASRTTKRSGVTDMLLYPLGPITAIFLVPCSEFSS